MRPSTKNSIKFESILIKKKKQEVKTKKQ